VSDQPLLLCGTRTFALEVADVVSATPGFRVAGFVENEDPERCARGHGGQTVHWVEDLEPFAADHEFLCALTTTHRRRFTNQMEALGVPAATVIHPTAVLSAQSSLGPGCVVLPATVVGSHTSIGRHAVINRGVLVGHHTEVGDHVTLGPGANVGGNTRVDDAVYVGIGATVLNGVSVGTGSVIGAGAVVTRDVPDRVQVMGVPARVVKEDIAGL